MVFLQDTFCCPQSPSATSYRPDLAPNLLRHALVAQCSLMLVRWRGILLGGSQGSQSMHQYQERPQRTRRKHWCNGLLVHMVFARFKRKQQPPTGRSAPRGCCFLLNLAKTICSNNPYAPMLPPFFLRPELALVHTLAAPSDATFIDDKVSDIKYSAEQVSLIVEIS